MVRSGQANREDALKEIEASPYHFEQETVDYVINKLEISKEEWKTIMESPIKSHDDYKTLLPFIRALKWPIKVATKMKVLPRILFLKYAK